MKPMILAFPSQLVPLELTNTSLCLQKETQMGNFFSLCKQSVLLGVNSTLLSLKGPLFLIHLCFQLTLTTSKFRLKKFWDVNRGQLGPEAKILTTVFFCFSSFHSKIPLKNGQTRPLFHFLSFLSTVQKNSLASGYRTGIFGVEGKHTDHYTSITAPIARFFAISI